jgi:hypothetical protein
MQIMADSSLSLSIQNLSQPETAGKAPYESPDHRLARASR